MYCFVSSALRYPAVRGLVSLCVALSAASCSVDVAEPEPVLLYAPSSLTVRAIGENLELSWVDSVSGESGFNIERRDPGTLYRRVGTTPENVTTFLDSTICTDTRYSYRVRAVYGDTESTPSDSVVAYVYFPRPASLTYTQVSASSIGLEWVDNSEFETGFLLERYSTAAGDFIPLDSTEQNTTSYVLAGMDTLRSYTIRVRATTNRNQSEPSRAVSAYWEYVSSNLEHTLEGHASAVQEGAFSPDGKFVATRSDDHTIRLWNCEEGALARTFAATSSVASMSFSQDGAYLATSSDSTIVVWDVLSGAQVRSMVSQGNVRVVRFSPSGTTLATAGDERVVRLWDPSTGVCVDSLYGHVSTIRALAFMPDGTVLASGGGDPGPDKGNTLIRLWNFGAGYLADALDAQTSYIRTLDFTPDPGLYASFLVCTSIDNVVRVMDLSGSMALILPGQAASVQRFPRLYATASAGIVSLWPELGGDSVLSFPAHSMDIIDVRFSPVGNAVVTCSRDGTAKIWSLSKGWLPRCTISCGSPL